ncbi:MAG: hypothetical protein E6J34_24020 [Chloroflexi bacterium]|nr:MAG: hypothetical protein E6J34_24020 [Chloroflexota bacterium]
MPQLPPWPSMDQIILGFLLLVTNSVTGAYRTIIEWAYGPAFAFGTNADVTYQQATVIKIWQVNVLAADGVLAIIIVWIAYNVILGVYEPLEMTWRVILAAVCVHASLQFAGLFIELNNALCSMVIGSIKPPLDVLSLLGIPHVPTNDMVAMVEDILIHVMAGVLVAENFVRVEVLDVLICISPLALLLFVAYSTQQWANLWAAAFFATLFLQFVQVVAMVLGASLIAGLATNSAVVGMLLGIGVLGLVVAMPKWVGSAATSVIGGSHRLPGQS